MTLPKNRINITNGWFIFKYDNIIKWFLYKENNDKMFTIGGVACSWMQTSTQSETPPREVIVKAKLLAGGI